jgi:hypothetical protein
MAPKPIKAEFRAQEPWALFVVVRCNGLKLEELIAPFQSKNRLEKLYIQYPRSKAKDIVDLEERCSKLQVLARFILHGVALAIK